MYISKWHILSTALCVLPYMFLFWGLFLYVVTCTHDGHRTRRRVSGVKTLIRHQNYRSSSISTNTPSANLPYAYPVPTSCIIFLPDSCLVKLLHFVTLSTDVACCNRPAPPAWPQPHFTVFDNTPTILTQFLPTLVEHTTESPVSQPPLDCWQQTRIFDGLVDDLPSFIITNHVTTPLC